MTIKKNIAILMTCHNRCYQTINAIKAVKNNQISADLKLHFIVVDDGSTDDTTESISLQFPDVTIIHGNGTLFWNRGMRTAFIYAKKIGYDFYLWLNDDTEIFSDAIVRLLSVYELKRKKYDYNIIVGSTKSVINGCLTYGAYYSTFGLLCKTESIHSDTQILECNSMNANCVLISESVAKKVGDLDFCFQHALGDIDYALRAWKLGVKIWAAPGFIGICEKNTDIGTYKDNNLPMCDRWRKIMGPKGLPYLSWFYFTKNHLGILWPLYWLWPYFRLLIDPIMVISEKYLKSIIKTYNSNV